MAASNSKKIAKNVLALYFRMFLTMAITLYTSRIILNTLGVENFGIYNVVGGVVTMFSFLNAAMMASTQRYLSYELGQNDYLRLRQTFSMSLIIHIIIAIIVIFLCETIGVWFLNTHLNIDIDKLNSANWVFQFSLFSLIITILNVPYSSAIIAHEDMKFFAYISIVEVILKLSIVFVLQYFDFDKLKLYALLIFFVTFSIQLIYHIYCLNKYRECSYKLIWNKYYFLNIGGFAGWNLIGVFAGIAYNQGVNIILNIFFGPVINAARAIAYQVQGAVNGFISNFQMAINPPIVKLYSAGKQDCVYSLVFLSSKYSFFLLLFFAIPILLETEQILFWWLKKIPDYTTLFTRLILIDILICSFSGSLQALVQATGYVKKYQLVVSGILLANLPISYLMLKLYFQPEITFLVSILLSCFALFGRLFILHKLIMFPLKSFILKILIRSVLIAIIASILPIIVFIYLECDVYVKFISVCLSSTISLLSMIYLLGMNGAERNLVKHYIRKYLCK